MNTYRPEETIRNIFIGLFFMIFPLALLSSCKTDGNLSSTVIDANESALNGSELILCKGYNLGIPPARYNTPELIQAWAAICQARVQRVNLGELK